jgi:hypothetical protein
MRELSERLDSCTGKRNKSLKDRDTSKDKLVSFLLLILGIL